MLDICVNLVGWNQLGTGLKSFRVINIDPCVIYVRYLCALTKNAVKKKKKKKPFFLFPSFVLFLNF
jgi:uncharacterized membrane protein YadS